MNDATILMHAYFEALHERLEAARGLVAADIEAMLPTAAKAFPQANLDIEKLDAYKEAALAFLEERIETYNPVGIQFLFDRPRSKEAFQMELQLNWYDSTAEFTQLAAAGGRIPLAWHLMAAIAALMTVVFGVIALRLHPRMRAALAAGELPKAAAALDGIRRLVVLNLALGIATIAVATLGRAL